MSRRRYSGFKSRIAATSSLTRIPAHGRRRLPRDWAAFLRCNTPHRRRSPTTGAACHPYSTKDQLGSWLREALGQTIV